MSDMIKDGTGKGYLAKVDDHGRLAVAANVIDHKQHHALYHKNLYIVNFDIVLGSTSETPMAIFKNLDGTKDFEIYSAEVNADTQTDVFWHFNDEYTSGGTVVTPVNSNRGSGATISTAQALVYEGGAADDLVLDSTDRVTFHSSFLSANSAHQMSFDGALILTSGTTASMTVQGSTSGRVNLTVIMAYHTAGTVL
jgi:hypothetical protein